MGTFFLYTFIICKRGNRREVWHKFRLIHNHASLVNMTLINALFIGSLRLSLFVGCRLTILPLLLGEARHASLDELSLEGVELNELPTPVSATSSQGRNLTSRIKLQSPLAISARVSQSIKDPHQASSHVFSLCFEESTFLFVLVLLEATGTISTQALHQNWTFSLFSVIALAVFFIRE